MYNESKRGFLFVIVLSVTLHGFLLLALLLMRYDNHFRLPIPEHMLQQRVSAPVIFKAPPAQPQQHLKPQPQPTSPTKTLPAPFLPLVEQEEKKVSEIKVPVLLTSGDAASAHATSHNKNNDAAAAPEQPKQVVPNNKQLIAETQEKLDIAAEKNMEHPVSQPEPKKQPIPQEQPHDSRLISLAGHNKVAFGPHTSLAPHEVTTPEPKHIFEKPFVPQQLAPQPASSFNKKITLAQIAENFLHRPPSEYNGTGVSTTSNHVATVIGGPAGAATEEQLRYERYAVKLMNCINTSFAILVRQFRFTHTPSTAELSFTFVMDINTKGDIVGLAVRQPTGNSQFDEFMVKVLYHAAKSFPPLPSYFKVSSCAFPIQCIIPTVIML